MPLRDVMKSFITEGYGVTTKCTVCRSGVDINTHGHLSLPCYVTEWKLLDFAMSATRRQINANPKRLSAPITHCNRPRRRCNNRREFRKPWRGHCEDSLCPPKSFWQKDAANIRTVIVPAKMRAEDYMPAKKIKSIRRSHTTYFSEKIYLHSKEDILTFKRRYTYLAK